MKKREPTGESWKCLLLQQAPTRQPLLFAIPVPP